MNTILFYAAFGLFACGIGLQILFALNSGYVAEGGTLVEPFFLIPTGYTLCIAGFLMGLVCYVRR